MKSNRRIYKFLNSKGFNLIQQDKSMYFGDYYKVFSNDDIEFMFSSSKSFESIDIRKKSEELWFDLDLVEALLKRNKNLNVCTSLNQIETFLENEFDNICSLFSEVKYNDTIMKLDKLGNERAKQIFPDQF